MIFGKIEYLNLLPFHVYMKRFNRHSQSAHVMRYKAGVPSQINRAFERRAIDAAFISSIASKRCRCLDLGIAAKKEVRSVLVIPGLDQQDTASATSNILAQVLGTHGQVLIGDKALKYYLQHPNTEAVDLAKLWYAEHQLPFVFARLCYHGKKKHYHSLAKGFLRKQHKIPRYILEEASKRTGISTNDILSYLTLIHYRLDPHALLSLKRFFRLAKQSH